ncbi:MAG: ribosome small subunit-dependent GTPase A [Gaiellaceae bacterium]
MPTFDLGELGWNADLADTLSPGLEPARVAAAHRGGYDVQTSAGTVRTRLPGRLRHESVDVAVGDWVGLGDGLIRVVLPRSSAIVRQAAGRATSSQTLAANVDLALVVSSLGPDLEPRRIERYLVTVWESGARPEVVLNKADRWEDPTPLVRAIEAVAAGVPVHVVSALTGLGCAGLRSRIRPGATAVLLGSSGVGKSTLVNRFAGAQLMETRETRADDDEGRHVTTRRELVLLPGGGVLIDTPGLRELQLWDADSGFAAVFTDIEQLASECRFGDCSHIREPGCAVLAAVDSGELALERLRSWRKLQRELRATAVRQDALLRKEDARRWGRIVREARERSRRR